MRAITTLLVAGLSGFAPGRGQAQTPAAEAPPEAAAPAEAGGPTEAEATAVTRYREGVAHFKAGRFAEALERFDVAYKLDPRPVLLFNLARVHEEMGHAEAAIEHFELYLAREPQAEDRADIERRIRVMSAIVAQRDARREAPPEVAPPSAPAPAGPPPLAEDTKLAAVAPVGRSTLPIWGWSAVGVGLAAAGVGVYYGLEADAAEGEHARAVTAAQKRRTASRAEDAATRANFAFITAGVLSAAGVLVFAFDAWSAPSTVSVAPIDGGAAFAWQRSF